MSLVQLERGTNAVHRPTAAVDSTGGGDAEAASAVTSALTVVARELPVDYAEVPQLLKAAVKEASEKSSAEGGVALIINCGVGHSGGFKLEHRVWCR
jgi:hypothetical protein